MKLEIKNNKFTINGEEIQIISGALHYFRIVPEYWRDRLEKLKLCGFNTVETYIAWNMTETDRDNFVLEGMSDFVKFVELAEEVGLYVILRPGPYICAEWDMGGFPAYLSEIDGIEFRADNKQFLERVDRYFDFIIPKIVPHLTTNGGNVIAMQVENEYGGFNKQDKSYLEHIRSGLIKRGIDVLLFTSDGADRQSILNGSLNDIYKTVNFGSRNEKVMAMMKEIQPDKPFFCMEFWAGWFDQWGSPHHTRDAHEVFEEYRSMIEKGGNVNFYMFHGGTNFGFTNGSNCNPKFEPTITSYDYFAPLNEYGDATELYYLLQDFLTERKGEKAARPEPVRRVGFGKVEFDASAGLFDTLDSCSSEYKNSPVKNMEYFHCYTGFILYTFRVKGLSGKLELGEVHDRAVVFADRKYIGLSERDGQCDEMSIDGETEVLEILVENMGHVNYGPRIYDKKGLTDRIRIGDTVLDAADINTIPMKTLGKIKYTGAHTAGLPAFFRGTFNADSTGDTFLRTDGFTKGVAFINGFNLGRFWRKGPQRTLYVPAPLIKKGINEVVIFDLYGSGCPSAELTDVHLTDMCE